MEISHARVWQYPQITLSWLRPLARNLSLGCRVTRHFVEDSRGRPRLAVDVYFSYARPFASVTVMWPRRPRRLCPILLGGNVSAAGPAARPALHIEAESAPWSARAKTGFKRRTRVQKDSPALTSSICFVLNTQPAPGSTWRLQTEAWPLKINVYFLRKNIFWSIFVKPWPQTLNP